MLTVRHLGASHYVVDEGEGRPRRSYARTAFYAFSSCLLLTLETVVASWGSRAGVGYRVAAVRGEIRSLNRAASRCPVKILLDHNPPAYSKPETPQNAKN